MDKSATKLPSAAAGSSGGSADTSTTGPAAGN